jgi:subtilisin family serine protease
MVRKSLVLLVFIAFLSISDVEIIAAASSYIVKAKSSALFDKLSSEILSSNAKIRKAMPFLVNSARNMKTSQLTAALNEFEKYYLIETDNSDASIIDYLKRSAYIESIEENHKYRIEELTESLTEAITPNDPFFPEQWGLNAIYAPEAWEKSKGEGVVVGVVDTGIDYLHPDLVKNLWINPGEDINGNGHFDPWSNTETRSGVTGDFDGIDNDGNGFTDDVIGFDFVDQTIENIGDYYSRDPLPYDENKHGTITSGVIAAVQNNKIGVSGVAPGAKIMTLRAFDLSGNAESDDIASAIVYAALNGARALNLSFGDNFRSQLVADAVHFAYLCGCAIFASSGNNGWDKPHYPSDLSETMSVGSSNAQNKRDYKSNYGSNISILAPGISIYSTSPDSSYATASGTSLAAPHATAAAALLLQIDPELTPDDIYGIINTTATSLDNGTWNEFNGNGILNVRDALNAVGKTNISISYPRQNAVFNKDSVHRIPVVASIATPMFDSYSLAIGKGLRPSKWSDDLVFSKVQTLNDTIIWLETADFADTAYTLKLVIEMKNERRIERRISFQIYSEANKLLLTNFKVLPAWNDEKNVVIVAARTNQPSLLSVKFRPLNSSEEYYEVFDGNRALTYQNLVIGKEAAAGVEMEAVATLRRADGDTICHEFVFKRENCDFPMRGFVPKNYSLPAAYLLNETTELYADGKPCVVVNELPQGNWGQTAVYCFEGDKFVKRDSVSETWIPVGFGDSNGNGLMEIFTKSSGMSLLFEPQSAGGNPFATKPFDKTNTNNLWAALLHDFNGDGRPELVANSDTAFQIYEFRDGGYEWMTFVKPLDSIPHVGTFPGAAAADLDGDGFEELCFGSTKGSIFVAKVKPDEPILDNRYEIVFADSVNLSTGSFFMADCDVDGDGSKEILIATYGTSSLYDEELTDELVWDFRLLKYIPNNGYNYIWRYNSIGVRTGLIAGNLSYKNGIATGNIDGEPGDEILLSVFPNLYVLKWNNSEQKPMPFWILPGVFSNGALTQDFDKNGINEIGVSNGNNVVFFEYSKDAANPSTPANFDGWATSETTARLQWKTAADADFVQIYRIVESGGSIVYQYVDSTSKDYYILTGLENKHYYEYAAVAVDGSGKQSQPTYAVGVYTHTIVKPVALAPSDNNTFQLSFSGALNYEKANPKLFKFAPTAGGNDFLINSALRANDTMLLLSCDENLSEGEYSLAVPSLVDLYGSPTCADTLLLSIGPIAPPVKELYLLNLEVVSPTSLLLRFSEPVTRADAENTFNYEIKPFGSIHSIELNSTNQTEALLILESRSGIGALGKDYTITARNISALSGRMMTRGAGSTLGFVMFPTDIDKAFIYPNPLNYNTAKEIYFANVLPYAEAIVLSLNGEMLVTVAEQDSNGGMPWNGMDSNGSRLKPGVYLFKIRKMNSDGSYTESALKKFVVVE